MNNQGFVNRRRLLSLKETAIFLNVSPMTVRRWIWEGAISYVIFGRDYKFDLLDLDKFIMEHKKRELEGKP